MSDPRPPRKRFHHIGLRVPEPQRGEVFVPETRVWVSNPNFHPQHIEYLRYEDDSPVDDDFKESPHIAYEVDDLAPHLMGKEVVLEPFALGDPPFATVAFTREHGIYVEYMHFEPGRSWHDD